MRVCLRSAAYYACRTYICVIHRRRRRRIRIINSHAKTSHRLRRREVAGHSYRSVSSIPPACAFCRLRIAATRVAVDWWSSLLARARSPPAFTFHTHTRVLYVYSSRNIITIIIIVCVCHTRNLPPPPHVSFVAFTRTQSRADKRPANFSKSIIVCSRPLFIISLHGLGVNRILVWLSRARRLTVFIFSVRFPLFFSSPRFYTMTIRAYTRRRPGVFARTVPSIQLQLRTRYTRRRHIV